MLKMKIIVMVISNRYTTCILFLLLMSCSKPAADYRGSDDTVVTRGDGLEKGVNDTLSYVGHISKFDDDELFYTDLLFVEGFDYDRYQELTNSSGDVEFEGSDFKRVKMLIGEIGQYFDLTGLGRIDVYNKNGTKLTAGRLSHIEYVEDLIEGRFVAVFEVDDPDVSDPVFCVGNPKSKLSEIDIVDYDDEELELELISSLNLDVDRVWHHEHYKVGNLAISTVSADTTAYVVEILNDLQLVLYKSDRSEVIDDMTIIPWYVNGRPIVLTSCSMPETDILWTSVLVFNGSEYDVRDSQRIAHGE